MNEAGGLKEVYGAGGILPLPVSLFQTLEARLAELEAAVGDHEGRLQEVESCT